MKVKKALCRRFSISLVTRNHFLETFKFDLSKFCSPSSCKDSSYFNSNSQSRNFCRIKGTITEYYSIVHDVTSCLPCTGQSKKPFKMAATCINEERFFISHGFEPCGLILSPYVAIFKRLCPSC